LTAFLDSHCQLLKDEIPPQIADIGVGTGFWTELLECWFQSQGSTTGFTVVDISEQALSLIKARHPHFETIRADLTTVDPSHLQERFGLVVSFYCLHHLPRIGDFLNGLRFAARSVAPNGVLLIMDPILSQPYSPFHELAFSSHEGNGMPRPLYLIDDVLESEGLARIAFAPAVSFILNGGIEARSRIGSATTNALWRLLQRVYRSDRATRVAGGAIRWADRLLKRCALAHSSSLVAYRKQP
jgi:SAM-dependent methyltransferase